MSFHYSLDCVQEAASVFAATYPVYGAASRCDMDELRRIISGGEDVNESLEQVKMSQFQIFLFI
jgi:hypothetical protein